MLAGPVPNRDVLVCPATSPVWSVLFPSVGALVTDTGGILSHPAIIAREFRVRRHRNPRQHVAAA
jgi:phosphoenolpyruvate synthase/pyruvate phosphate dikinase